MLFALVRMLTAATSESILDFGDTPLCHSHPTFITFDPPGGPATDMRPSGINPAGAITGSYTTDPSGVVHGFMRPPTAPSRRSMPPGAVAQDRCRQLAYPGAINPAGVITGTTLTRAAWLTASCALPDGTFTTFDAPAAGNSTIRSPSTRPGTITGYYYDATFVGHGFLRAPHGTLITFDAPGAVCGTPPMTSTRQARSRETTLTRAAWLTASCGLPTAPSPTFDVPGRPRALSAGGPSTRRGRSREFYYDASGVDHGFLRAPGRHHHHVRCPGRGTGCGQGTILGINPAGAITG